MAVSALYVLVFEVLAGHLGGLEKSGTEAIPLATVIREKQPRETEEASSRKLE